MSVVELSIYVQVSAYRTAWMAAYALQLGLRRAWGRAFLAYESLTGWRPVDGWNDAECSGTIMCMREGKRHRRGCLGKPERINSLLKTERG